MNPRHVLIQRWVGMTWSSPTMWSIRLTRSGTAASAMSAWVAKA